MKITEVSQVNPNAKTETRIDEDGTITMQHFEEVDNFLKVNHYLRSMPESYKTHEGNRMMARIPLTLYHELEKKGITKDPARFKRWLNDPDNKYWRVSEGRM